MQLLPTSSKKRAVYLFAVVGGLLFAALLFATDVYQQNYGIGNGEAGWRYSFTFMEAAPLAILMQALHLAENLNKWSIGTIMVVKAVLDGILFGLILLPIGFFWQYIIKDSSNL